MLTPTLAGLPAPVGWFRAAGDPRAEFDRMIGWTPFTAVYNTSGQPAVSVPLHATPEGLPVGVQLVGRPADEADAAAAVGAARAGAAVARPPARTSGERDAARPRQT